MAASRLGHGLRVAPRIASAFNLQEPIALLTLHFESQKTAAKLAGFASVGGHHQDPALSSAHMTQRLIASRSKFQVCRRSTATTSKDMEVA